jgi:hypothetical protein
MSAFRNLMNNAHKLIEPVNKGQLHIKSHVQVPFNVLYIQACLCQACDLNSCENHEFIVKLPKSYEKIDTRMI